MTKKQTKKTTSPTEIAKKQRIVSFIGRIKKKETLDRSEIRELERYEKSQQIDKPKVKEKKDTLTVQQADFCREYIIDLNTQKAATRAGYSPRTAAQSGCRLLKAVKVQERIQELRAGREKRTEITADRVLEELGKIAFSNIGDFVELVDCDGLISMKVLEKLSKEQLACISELTEYETDRGNKRFRFKLHDKIKGLELIGRHLSMFNENINHKFQDGCGVLMVAPDMDKEQWSQRAKKQSQEQGKKKQ